MHELGVVAEVVRTVEEFARGNGLSRVDTIVLQIGELSSMVPRYIEDCFPAAIDGTTLESAKLSIEILPAHARCKACGKVSRALECHGACPHCGNGDLELLGGKEFMIKEIIAC